MGVKSPLQARAWRVGAENDNLEKQLILITDYILSNNNSCDNKLRVKDICNVVTGKEDANFAAENGKYNFFTCSKVASKCNSYAFDTSAVLVAGNGDFNVKHFTGKFNAYQRTYVLMADKKYYAILYVSCLKMIKALKQKSAGSIVKFITKSDIEEIPLIVPEDHELINTMNNLLIHIEKNTSEIERLEKTRNWLLPILMNSQATVD